MNDLDILEYNGAGYMPLHDFNGWRVAFLRCDDEYKKGNTKYLERHMESDEIFVLIDGEATLIIGKDMKEIKMKKNKVYNIKKGAWHNIYMSEDANILLVENTDTGEENSEYWHFD